MNTRLSPLLMWSGVAVLIVAGISMLFLSFGGVEKTPAEDINAVYTNAASTVAAQQQTLQAGMSTATPNPALSLPTASLPAPTSSTLQPLTPVLLPTFAPAVGNTAASGGVVSNAVGCDNAVYVSDVTIPDGTTIAAGEYFTKTWKVTNIGSCAWTETYKLVYVSGDSLGGKATAIKKIVNPGESADISVVLTSSSATGDITGGWKLSNDKGQTFGDLLTVVVNSGTPAAAATTAVPTATPTNTAATGG